MSGDAEASCRETLRAALRQRVAPPDSGRTVRRVMTITMIGRVRSGLDTAVVAGAETLENGDFRVMRVDSTETWTDGSDLLFIDRRNKVIRLVDLSDKREVVAAQSMWNAAYADSLAACARDLTCDDALESAQHAGDPLRRSAFAIDPSRQAFVNARRITTDIRDDGEIVRFLVQHPEGAPLISTEYRVEEVDRSCRAVDPSAPIVDRAFRSDGTLQDEFAGYRVTRR